MGPLAIVACIAAMSGAGTLGCSDRAGSAAEAPVKAIPELPADATRWVNGAPVSIGARDKVLLVEAWHPA